MEKLKFIKERKNDYNSNDFIDEIASASKSLGIFEAKISAYKFDKILIPLLHIKEAVSSMNIEGTQTTISDVLENEINEEKKEDEIGKEASSHIKALLFGASYLNENNFNHSFIKKLHEIMLKKEGLSKKETSIGEYKTVDNYIVNSVGTVVFTPPSYQETRKYMDELIDYMNDTNINVNPLIKAAIMHSQFESIHPFQDGNGRIGRLLISLYLYKSKVIKVPFFYISEAISQDKSVYYNKLTDSRKNDYTEWIKYFLKKCTIQANQHIRYVDSLNELYDKVSYSIKKCINTPKYEQIVECIFTQPILTAKYFSETINVSLQQARKYLNTLESAHILVGNDRTRNRYFYFEELLDLVRRY